jgi:hypothetical protein
MIDEWEVYEGLRYLIIAIKSKDIRLLVGTIGDKIWCDQLKNKSSRRVTYGNPRYSIGSKANSIYFLNDRSVLLGTKYFGRHSSVTSKQINVNQALTSSQ